MEKPSQKDASAFGAVATNPKLSNNIKNKNIVNTFFIIDLLYTFKNFCQYFKGILT